MAQGWESSLRIFSYPKGWKQGNSSFGAYFLWLDSVGLALNPEISEDTDKMVFSRMLPPSLREIRQFTPGGNETHQPRTDDSVNVMMGFFQTCNPEGTIYSGASGTIFKGTLTFAIPFNMPKYLGSSWGTVKNNVYGSANSVYPVGAQLILSEELTGIGSNSISYKWGIVESLAWAVAYGETLKLTPEYKFGTFSIDKTTGVIKPPSDYGTLSSNSKLVDWEVKVGYTQGGVVKDYVVDSWNETWAANTTQRGALGTLGYSNYPYSGRPIETGNIKFELVDLDWLNTLIKNGSASISIRIQTAIDDWIQIDHPFVKLDPTDVAPSSPTEPIDVTLNYKAYPDENLGTSSTIVKICVQNLDIRAATFLVGYGLPTGTLVT